MKDGGGEGVGELALGWPWFDVCVDLNKRETGDRNENAVCELNYSCSEIGGVLTQGWLLPGSFADGPGNEENYECNSDTWSGSVVC